MHVQEGAHLAQFMQLVQVRFELDVVQKSRGRSSAALQQVFEASALLKNILYFSPGERARFLELLCFAYGVLQRQVYSVSHLNDVRANDSCPAFVMVEGFPSHRRLLNEAEEVQSPLQIQRTLLCDLAADSCHFLSNPETPPNLFSSCTVHCKCTIIQVQVQVRFIQVCCAVVFC